MDYETLLKRTRALYGEIRQYLKDIQYNEYDDLSGVDYDREDLDAGLVVSELRYCAAKLDDVQRVMEYLQLPVIEESRIHRNSAGRYEMDSGRVFTSGSPIEALLEGDDGPFWAVSRVEADSEGRYYIVNYSKYPMDGLLVRRRGRP